MNQYSQSYSSQIMIYGGKPILLAQSSYHANAKDTSAFFLIEIDLSTFEMKKMLQELNVYPNSGSCLYSVNQNFMLDDGTNSATTQKLKNSTQAEIEKLDSRIAQDGSKEFIRLQNNGSKYLAVYAPSNYLSFTLMRYIPESVLLNKLILYRMLFWALVVTAVVTSVAFALYIYRLIHTPLLQLEKAFNEVKEGNLDIRIKHNRKDEFKYIYEQFNQMVSNLRELIDQSYKSKILAQKSELKQLQSQINPHFLYNSFFILQKRIKYGDNENALLFAEQLGNFFQFITRNGSDEVPLAKEVEHARIYADIQAVRFARRISVRFEELPENWERVIVPRLILQPIIENAFEHSLENIEEGGLLCVSFEEDGGTLYIHVENNGVKFDTPELRELNNKLSLDSDDIEVTGLVNIHRRLKLRFGNASGVVLAPSATGGLRVTLILKEAQGNVV